jgi:hypothetical protein
MLGSSFDGERANAARMIAAMADKHKLTIVELIYGESAPQRTRPRAKPAQKKVDGGPILKALADIAENADAFEFILTAWECQFAADVSARYSSDYDLSDKQIVVAERIINKVERAQR